MPEALVTCPDCQTTGFTVNGLKRHRCRGIRRNAPVADCEVLPPETALQAPGNAPEEALHNHYHRCAQTAAAQATGYAILCGLELQKIRMEMSKPGKRNDLNLGNRGSQGWDQWVEANCEFSKRTADKYIAVAEGVKGRLARTTTSRNLLGCIDCAPSALDEKQRDTLLKSVGKVTEGETLRQLYLDFGIVKANPNDNLRKGGATHHNGRPNPRDLSAEDAMLRANQIVKLLAEWVGNCQHQKLPKADLALFDQHLLAARETLRPYVK